jgi:RNA polymerase sigma-70 factor (ECF subfamily)
MGTSDEATEAQVSEAWRANHPYLIDLAFAMLRDIGNAEDAVQESFARLANADFNQIEDERGWLIVVTSRICLDQMNSARSRLEAAHDTSTIELAGVTVSQAVQVDPADRVTLDDEVRLALLVVLQELKPAERVVFVLHDVFGFPFDNISDTIGRPASSCRQLARRARLKIKSANAQVSVEVDTAENRLVIEQFIEACSNGDVSALLQVLDPDVAGGVDFGPLDKRSGKVRRGSARVANTFLRYFGAWTTLVSNPIRGRTVVLAFVNRQLSAVILLNLQDGRIQKIHVIADPRTIGFLSEQLSLASFGGDP